MMTLLLFLALPPLAIAFVLDWMRKITLRSSPIGPVPRYP
jgi:hypothetical protein